MRYLSSKLVPVKVAYLRLATNCNATCQMCTFWRTRPKQMDSAILSKLFQKLAALGYSDVIFTGGEPLIADYIDQAVASARRCDLQIGVITNGALLPEYLSAQGKCEGVHRFYVSVDSPIAENHDAIRGTRCLEYIEMGLNSRRPGTEIVINTVLSKLNSKDILMLPNWMVQHDVGMINVIFMKHPSLALKKDEAHALAEELLRLCHAHGIRHHVTSLPDGVPCDLAWKCLLDDPWPQQCFVGNVCLFVEHDGTTFPCNCTPYVGREAGIGISIDRIPLADPPSSQVFKAKLGAFNSCRDICDLSNRLYNYIVSTTKTGAAT